MAMNSALAALALVLVAGGAPAATAQTVTGVWRLNGPGPVIAPEVYGQFMEQLGTGIDGGPGGADGGAQLVGHGLDDGEVVARLHAAPARDDDPGAGQFGPLELGQFLADEAGQPAVLGRLDGLDRGRAGAGLGGGEGGAARSRPALADGDTNWPVARGDCTHPAL